MAPTYKLTYFNLRGIAEPIRYIFAYKGIEYEDFRIADKDWLEYKSKQPFGYIPVLEVDGKILAETMAIMRYLANEYGLGGKNNWDAAQADMLVNSIQECIDKLRTFARKTKDEEKKEELKNIWLTEIAPPCLERLERYLKNNGGKYFVGDGLTLADFVLAPFTEIVMPLIPTLREDYPLLAAHLDAFNEIPSIKAWIEKRPVTPL